MFTYPVPRQKKTLLYGLCGFVYAYEDGHEPDVFLLLSVRLGEPHTPATLSLCAVFFFFSKTK